MASARPDGWAVASPLPAASRFSPRPAASARALLRVVLACLEVEHGLGLFVGSVRRRRGRGGWRELESSVAALDGLGEGARSPSVLDERTDQAPHPPRRAACFLASRSLGAAPRRSAALRSSVSPGSCRPQHSRYLVNFRDRLRRSMTRADLASSPSRRSLSFLAFSVAATLSTRRRARFHLGPVALSTPRSSRASRDRLRRSMSGRDPGQGLTPAVAELPRVGDYVRLLLRTSARFAPAGRSPWGCARQRGLFRRRVGGLRRAQPGAGRRCAEGQTPWRAHPR